MSGEISVIVPTCGRPDQLRRALESVFSQTLRPTEVIVVDDNAKDPDIRTRTRDIVETLKSECADEISLQYLTPDANLGGAGARNHGAERAHGDYLAFLDDDDWWLPRKLELQMSAFAAAPEAGLVYTSRRIVDPDGEDKRIRSAEHRGWISDVLLAENVIGTTSCAMVRREVFEEVGGFDASLPARQDIDLWLRVARAHKIELVAEPVTVQQEHDDGRISRRFGAKTAGLEMFLDKHYSDIVARPEVLAAHCVRIGTHYLKYGHPLRGRRWLLRALRERPTLRVLRRLVFGVRTGRGRGRGRRR
jgi:GT2 family glycosyltransferase